LKEKDKVLAHIYRNKNGLKEVLVFDHPEVPEVNPQVPAGTLKENEDPIDGVLREILEESGLTFNKVDSFLGKFTYIDKSKNEIHKRYIYEIHSEDLPDSWSHIVKSDDEDDGERFDYYWLALDEAKRLLVADQGKQLPFAQRHIIQNTDISEKHINENLKVGGIHSNFSTYFNLKRVAAGYFSIPPGYRSSEPHAESLEEEFVFIISGEIDLWLNGSVKKMTKGDCIGFPAGTGVGHTFINNYQGNCELFVSGDRTKSNNRYHFHLDPSLKSECGDKWWDDMPKQLLGNHDGLPGDFDKSHFDESIEVLNAYENIPNSSFSYPGDSETFSNGVCLSRHFGMKNIAIWLERIPAGKRTSWPHAHSVEEEIVYVLEGTPTVYLDKILYSASPGCLIDFKAGSGVAHTLINESNEYIYYLCAGECEPLEDKICYLEHPERNEQMKLEGHYWSR
jgi:uncharacterized cupin superfamily protein/8-oxo-dGTP pyrophosphatase MutT (NUDIX family)